MVCDQEFIIMLEAPLKHLTTGFLQQQATSKHQAG
jgi:hypothetical protein